MMASAVDSAGTTTKGICPAGPAAVRSAHGAIVTHVVIDPWV